ncbi:hypothetical protein V8G54_022098 [Vigna mungo]|uniref:Uncharacterized protein n=1 Tax=Vigna mungo TaxID=3915 RepID=A0AAQ3NHA5_VIGMU
MAVKPYPNKDDIVIKKRQSGVNELADLVRVKLGPKGRNVVLESKCGSPKMVNDGVTVAKEVEVEDVVRNMGAKLAPTSPTTNSPGNGAAELVSTIIFSFPFSVSSRQSNSVVLTKRSRDFGVSTMAVKPYPNKDDIVIKKRQSGVNELADLVRVKLGPKGRNVVLESKCGSPKMVNDGVTVAKEVEVEDVVRNMGAKLVKHLINSQKQYIFKFWLLCSHGIQPQLKMDVAEVNQNTTTKVNTALKNPISSEKKIEGKKERRRWGYLDPFLRLIVVKKP